MSHKHHRPLTDRQNVLHIFTKHNKLHKDRVVPDCNSDSSRAKKTARSANACKMKRLKTRKERSQMREGRGQKHIDPHCFHQCRRENKLDCYHSCSHSRPLRPPSKENVLTMAEHGQEPCIITDGRLIGHRGLFNHEVKSVDIERLEVELPLLCRRHLLAETREALLHVLQERHGPQLQGNLLRLQHQLCYSKRQTDKEHTAGHVRRADSRKDSNSGTQASGYRENDPELEHSRPTSHRLTPSKRRRKQMFPQRMEQHFTESQHRDRAVQWNTSLIVEPAVDPSREFTKTHSPQLVMDFLPSVSSSPPIFVSSVWGVQTGPQLTQDRQFQKGQGKVTDHAQNMSRWVANGQYQSVTPNQQKHRQPTTTNSQQKVRTERKPKNVLNEETSDGIHPAKEQGLIRKAETEEKQHSGGALRWVSRREGNR
ncbi:hypothetical protein AAFF_G00125830 [Aldrovandia affinis]|uniref:Uncharacterized protein n=1 Tax=Aldrovandia affinis TaxID=143900 RepID=A0AAD7W9G2_9TELE|nr:hypothetical protein AAFF_G00125830 [Aldrovandia affinis]